jgi:tetratricopeptide (TPR) repeat protein
LLEKAVSLKPDNAPYHVSLGEAYLNLNQPDKALESFDRAVEILPVPGIWNNVAYELSRHKAHLDRAQRYAESAIAATAASLRNVTLDRLRAEDLGQVSAIGSFWDTLGWIYFQNGDLEQAERFIHAAWELSQHGEVGYHLAQVHEKRGNKEEAIRAYAMALAASRPPMETRQRLAALVGSDKKVDALVDQARRELAGTRTLKLGALVNESAEAEFFVLLAPGSKVEAVKFIRGSEKLRTFTGTLQASNFATTFPDATPTKLVRRGVLSCTTTATGCSFVLLTPDDVHSVN